MRYGPNCAPSSPGPATPSWPSSSCRTRASTRGGWSTPRWPAPPAWSAGPELGAGARAGGWKPRDEAGWDEHCGPCDLADGYRFAAREVDRPGVPPGNEHAIRVASAVARTRDRYSPRARVGYELLLPDLIDGALPSTPQAQAFKALINRLPPEECDRVRTITEVEELVCGILGE